MKKHSVLMARWNLIIFILVEIKNDNIGLEFSGETTAVECVWEPGEFSCQYDYYDKIIELLKEKYFTVTGQEINARLIIFALLPKMTSSSKSAIESLEKMANNEKYHFETRRFAREILSDY